MNKLSDDYIGKMSEGNILKEYSNYLQKLSIENANDSVKENLRQQQMLNYEEFREYYILTLFGKCSFVDKLVKEFQLRVILP